ncbi:MAG: pyridoxal phosphate-dependent aminotransferase [Gammaproteobacteria bacterium]|nr:pyridoxal phosphate-dependent aminotransferase [Gammaproteobacteria bacterium]
MPLTPRFASRLSDIEPFRVVEVLTRATELEQQGRDIVHLGAGEPDFTTADPIVQAGRQALADGRTHYSQAGGIPQLREALSRWYQSEYGLVIDPGRIMVTPGASGALLLLSALLLNPGESMLLPDPGYPCNRHFMRLVEGRGDLVAVSAESGFQLDSDLVGLHWSEGTVGALVASPANPTGGVLNREQLRGLSEAVRERSGYLIVDEIYHGLGFGVETPSVLDIDQDAYVINSFSKYFGMTGWRLGWLVAPAAAVPELEKLAQNLFISMSTMAQYAALAAFAPETREILDQRRDIFAQRRDFLLSELLKLGFEVPQCPDGAFYIYANIKRFANDSQQFCLDMLEQHGIAITPGADFGRNRASDYVRFSYTTGMDRIEEAVARMTRVLA